MTHHGNEHVDEDYNDRHVIECKEEHAHTLYHRSGVTADRERIGEATPQLFLRVLDLYAVHVYETKHGPEETVQGSRQAETDTMMSYNYYDTPKYLKIMTHCNVLYL